MDLQEVMSDSQIIHQALKPNRLLHSFVKAIYSTSVVNKAIVDCKVLRQLTGARDKVNTYPIVDRHLSRSPA